MSGSVQRERNPEPGIASHRRQDKFVIVEVNNCPGVVVPEQNEASVNSDYLI